MNRMDFFYLQLRHMRTKIHEICMDIALAIGHIGDIVKWAKIHGFYMDLADRALRNNEEALSGISCMERCMENIGGLLPDL